MQKFWSVGRDVPSLRINSIGAGDNDAFFVGEVLPFLNQRQPVSTRAVQQDKQRCGVCCCHLVGNNQIVSACLALRFRGLFPYLLAKGAMCKRQSQQNTRKDEASLHQDFSSSKVLTFSTGRPSTARPPRSTIGR